MADNYTQIEPAPEAPSDYITISNYEPLVANLKAAETQGNIKNIKVSENTWNRYVYGTGWTQVRQITFEVPEDNKDARYLSKLKIHLCEVFDGNILASYSTKNRSMQLLLY